MKTTSASGTRSPRARTRSTAAGRAQPSATSAARRSTALKPLGAARVIPERSGQTADDAVSFVSHSDGWYWIAAGGAQEFGPFATLADARADHDAYGDEGFTETEAIAEAESEIGIADWIDAETGAPAEGQSPPHLEDH